MRKRQINDTSTGENCHHRKVGGIEPKRTTSGSKKREIYQEVTDRIISYLDQGTAPWRSPVKRGTGDGWPKNLESGKRYRGINVFLLGMRAWESGFASDYWLTFKQAKSAGGQVRKGEKGSLVTFWKLYEKEDRESGEEITLPVLKHYTAFNLEQVDGIKIPDAPDAEPNEVRYEPIKRAESIVQGYHDKPVIEHGGFRAYYQPVSDVVRITTVSGSCHRKWSMWTLSKCAISNLDKKYAASDPSHPVTCSGQSRLTHSGLCVDCCTEAGCGPLQPLTGRGIGGAKELPLNFSTPSSAIGK